LKRRTGELLLLLLFAACLGFALLDSARFFVRLDLTRAKAYTLSPVSRKILAGLPDQVQVTYYLSDTLRSLSPASGRVIDLLHEYAAAARGRMSVAVLDPQRSGRVDAARRFGVTPHQVQVIQKSEQRTVEVFSGIVVEYLDRYSTLPAVFTADGLEFNLSLTVRKLLAGRRLAVGVLVGRPDKSLARDYENLQTGLARDYAVREYLPGERIPPELDALVVLGGLDLGADSLRPLDRYLREGGGILFAVKGLKVETRQAFDAEAAGPAPLLELIASYGVRVGREMVLDEAAREYRLPQQAEGRIAWESLGKYPPWVSVRTPNVASGNPITANFAGLDLLWPVALEAWPVEGVQAEVLVKSSSTAWTMKEPFIVDPFRVPQSAAQASGGQASAGQCVLAYALSGIFPSRFAPGAVGRPARMIVIGDDDFASDLLVFSDSLYNVFFLQNVVLWLSGQEDLLAIKTRAPAEGRLDRIANPAVRARLVRSAQILNVAGIPALVLLFGALRLFARRERKPGR
jgi:ABC-2 type transport system permease protein